MSLLSRDSDDSRQGGDISEHPANLFSILVFFVGFVTLLSSCAKRSDPGRAAEELVDAFVAADVKRAQSVTVPEQWKRIERWMAERQPFKCRGVSADKWDSPRMTGGGSSDAAQSEWNYGLTYQCPSNDTPYCLSIEDILVKKTADGWVVYDWGAIREAYDYGYRCSEMPPLEEP